MADTPERKEIQAAIDRLLAGTPLRSTGELTVVQLAAESGVKRWKLTHQHVDLMRSFQAAARQEDTEPPVTARWRARIAELEEDNRALRQRNASLQATVQAYAEIIADLSTAIEDSSPRALAEIRAIR